MHFILRKLPGSGFSLRLTLFALGTALLALQSTDAADEPAMFSEDDVAFFETNVRPLLAKRCYQCHSRAAEQKDQLKAGLFLDSRAGHLAGGDSGAAIVPGKPDESVVVDAINYRSYEMPPDGKLSAKEIRLIEEWIRRGAPWPAEKISPLPADPAHYDWNQLRSSHWAWHSVTRTPPPQVKHPDWCRSGIDRFVLAELERTGLTPSPEAAPAVLLRRLSLDLIGLPPTPAEIDQFAAAHAEDVDHAMEQAVDRLLASPRYGERWGRHWLDVARYSDGYGGFLDNTALNSAWRYRDWVVDAFNRDMPYDEFLTRQICGDLIDDGRDAVATGFFALGPTYRSDGGDPDSVAQAKSETLDDRLDTFGRGILGLTIACARCHDHKFDPIPQRDYYSLAGIFNNTNVVEHPLAPQPDVDAYNKRQREINDKQKELNNTRGEIKKQKRKPTDEEQARIDSLQSELDELRQTAPPKYPFAHALADSGSGDMHVALRGNLRKPGKLAPRGFPQILAQDDSSAFASITGSGRIDLARAVVDPRNPLTARVMVNRIWMHHFGAGLVRSPSNFGDLGEPPTHPQLLDWLAATFVESGWSIKQLHRTILLSSTWRQSSRFREEAFRKDGDNRLLWRMTPRRMDVEVWRDSLLAVTRELDVTPGGPPNERILDSRRRTLYAKVSRNGDRFSSDEFLRLFDFPMMRATIAKRPKSIVPQQFLFMMNSSFMVDRARALSHRLAEAADSDAERIKLAYRLLYSRDAAPREIEIGTAFLQQAEPQAKLTPWEQYAQVLLSANEFMSIR